MVPFPFAALGVIGDPKGEEEDEVMKLGADLRNAGDVTLVEAVLTRVA
jgi:hypothetical protein